MLFEVLYSTNLLILLGLYLGVLFIAVEVGYRFGQRHRERNLNENLFSLVPTSLFGLLALLLGFTFSMALSRYDARKQALLHEANAISTAWLRAGLLKDDDEIQKARSTLRTYLENRIRLPGWAEAEDVRSAFLAHELTLERELWRSIERNNRTDRTPQAALFASALNEVFDRSSERWFLAGDHVPEAAYWAILLVAVASLATLAELYAFRHQKRRILYVVALLVAGIFVLIQDVDRPARGVIRIDNQVLSEVLQSWS